MKIGILGLTGRMGQAIAQICFEKNHIELIGGYSRSKEAFHSFIWEGIERKIKNFTNLDEFIQSIDVLIDFSHHSICQTYLDLCVKYQKAVVIGTTGFTQAEIELIKKSSLEIPLLQSGNMSLGVNLLAALTKKASSLLGEDWDIEITEAHHHNKVDSPSGTAIMLGEAAAEGRNITLSDKACYERYGQVGARPKGEIGFSVIRAGSIIGDHTVLFGHEDEMITLSHRAQTRFIFARGAVFAAEKLVLKPKDFYNMQDVLEVL